MLKVKNRKSILGRDSFRIANVSLSAHNWPIIKHRVAEIASAIDKASAGSFTLE